MTSTCFASKWAELLSCLQTWDIYTWQNSCEAANELYTRAAIADGGGDNSFIAFANINESPSRTKSWIGKSLASCNPISKAFLQPQWHQGVPLSSCYKLQPNCFHPGLVSPPLPLIHVFNDSNQNKSLSPTIRKRKPLPISIEI